MLDNDSEITVERLQEIIELLREFEPETPEEIALIVKELAKEVIRLQLRVADLVKFIESEGEVG